MNQTQDPTANARLIGRDATDEGATSDNVLVVSGEIRSGRPFTELQMADGQVLRLPTALFMSTSAERELGSGTGEPSLESFLSEPIESGDTTVIPVIEERLDISRRTVPTGKVRLQKTVQEYHHALDEPLAVRTFDIERIVLNQPVEAAPSVRHEGDTTIYPLVEEQLILTKQLVLKEEVRVTQRDTVRRDTQVVTLRREHLAVEREPLR